MSNFVFPILANEQALNLDSVTDFRKSAFHRRNGGELVYTITFNLRHGGFISWQYDSREDRDAEWDELEMSIRTRQSPIWGVDMASGPDVTVKGTFPHEHDAEWDGLEMSIRARQTTTGES